MADTPQAAGRGTGTKDNKQHKENTKAKGDPPFLWPGTPTLFAARRDPTSLFCPLSCLQSAS